MKNGGVLMKRAVNFKSVFNETQKSSVVYGS